ncbi:hypothetical protein DWZ57_21190, partial [Bacteroides fragilis]
ATAEGKVYQTEHYNHIQIIEINISISFFPTTLIFRVVRFTSNFPISFDHYLAKRISLSPLITTLRREQLVKES